MRTNRKILVVLNLVLASLFISCFKKGEPTIYLIPDSYRGAVEIVFDQDGSSTKYKNALGRDSIYTRQPGAPVKYEGESRIYEIPANGILLTQFHKNSGSYEAEYYFVDNNGSKTKLKTISHSDIQANRIHDINEVAIFNIGTGAYSNPEISYEGFLVSSLQDLKTKYGRAYYSGFDKQVKEVMNYNDF
jgi:hypothetical protein